MIFVLLVGCGEQANQSKDSAVLLTDRSGDELLEAYNTALCDLYIQEECREGFAQCSAPTGNFSDWADCMNSQLLSQQHCAHLPLLLEENRREAELCISTLEKVSCDDPLCIDSEPIFKHEYCETIAGLLVQNCSGFGP